MRRPIPVKSFLLFSTIFVRSANFFRAAKPPLSPPFHPHSELSNFCSVQVGCSRFLRCCYLGSVLDFLLTREVGQGPSRSHLNSVELSCSVQTLSLCQASLGRYGHRLLTIAQRFVNLSTHPQPMQQYRQLSRYRHHRPFLGVLSSSRRELQSPAPQITVFTKGSILITLFADVHLWFALARV